MYHLLQIVCLRFLSIVNIKILPPFSANSTTPCTSVESEWENNPEIERCNQYDWVLIVITACYMVLSNLLLVILVIALLSYRFGKVQANSERLWRYWRYAVIMDYRTRVPAPLNLVLRPFMFIFRCVKRCNSKKEKTDHNAIKRVEILQTISVIKCIRAEKNSEE